MISLEEHEKQVEGLNVRMFALQTQLLAVRNEVASLQETVKANAEEKEQTFKRNKQRLKQIEETAQLVRQANKRRMEQEEAQLRQFEQEMIERENKEKIEQCEAQQRQFERLEQERLEREKLERNPQQPESQPAHQSIFHEQKRRRDQYNRKALAEMAQIERREGPQEFAKYHMVEAEVLEDYWDVKIELRQQKKLIAELQKASELKDQSISKLKKELEAAAKLISSQGN